jgi:3-methyladenine DNA glycosylase/8-oxoguanine DNA glycosylase
MTTKRPQGLDARTAARALARADPPLGRLIERVGPCRLELNAIQSPFASLAEAIVYQQLTGRAAATIHGRFVALFRPRRFPSPEDVLAQRDDVLRGAGLSRAKVAALKDLAAKTKDGTVPPLRDLRRMDDDAIIDRLTRVRGVGRWTVEMLLIFRLGRPDVLPAGDYGIRKGFRLAFGTRGLPTPRQLLRRGERWRPHRTVASWYLWRALEPGVLVDGAGD